MAKNLNPNAIPDNLTLNGVSVKPGCAADSFAAHFHEKIRLNSFKVKINMVGVYNGKCKLIVQNRNFMTAVDVKCCLDELKNVKCEGFNRIPGCVICDARDKLLPPLVALSDQIYLSYKIPEQWKVTKIIPIFKKGNKTQIEKYFYF